MIAPTTALQRTYRYLRMAVAGTVVVIFVAVGVTAAQTGWLTSISDYYYTPARDLFVGALLAASLGLITLSGRGVDRALLDTAALFAPLIAIVPTTLAPGTVPDVDVRCRFRCFPPAYEAEVAVGVTTYLVVGLLACAAVAVLVLRRQISAGAAGFSLGVCFLVLLAVGGTWLFARDLFLAQAHFAAVIAFFGLFAAVALRSAIPRRGSTWRFRVAYALIALLLIATLVVDITFQQRALDAGFPIVLATEAAALTLFFAFWITQCAEKWEDPDPGLRSPVT